MASVAFMGVLLELVALPATYPVAKRGDAAATVKIIGRFAGPSGVLWDFYPI
jgi:hypothetical protein